ncbi:MAG: hypothetical protein QG636_106 [Patescibacteria group bacterium]|nr:hypothetical protein [Patescibacteria group bacterium]
MEKIQATVGILTFNSGNTLARALESVQNFADIVICDGGSADDTLDIAASFGARVITQDRNFQNGNGVLRDYAGVRNQCLDTAVFDWFLYIDSDEQATPELVAEICRITEQREPVFLVYNVSPRIVLDGVRIQHSSNYPGWQNRFFNKRSGARFRKAVHERIDYDKAEYPAGFLKGHWLYFISNNQDGVKNRKYAYMDATHHATKKSSVFLVLVGKRLIVLLKAVLKILYNRVRYGNKANLPLVLEFTRVQYHIYFLQALARHFFNRTS